MITIEDVARETNMEVCHGHEGYNGWPYAVKYVSFRVFCFLSFPQPIGMKLFLCGAGYTYCPRTRRELKVLIDAFRPTREKK